jgi:hypothetical protein
LADLRIDADSMHHQLPGKIEPRPLRDFYSSILRAHN